MTKIQVALTTAYCLAAMTTNAIGADVLSRPPMPTWPHRGVGLMTTHVECRDWAAGRRDLYLKCMRHTWGGSVEEFLKD